jgi:predicted phosphodiesterase
MPARLFAVCADVHANAAALKAVVRDACAVAHRLDLAPPTWVFLGDLVDYGPDPNACVRLIQSLGGYVIRGNHEIAVTGPFDRPPECVARRWWPITLWTRHRLTAEHRRLLAGLAREVVAPAGLEGFTLFHGSLVDGEDGRIQSHAEAEDNMRRLSTPFGLYGHTHFQGYYTDGVGQATLHLAHPAETPLARWPKGCKGAPATSGSADAWIRLPGRGLRALINPGSVGQPRMHPVLRSGKAPHDQKAAYLLLRLNGSGPGEAQFRRVAYDVARTIRGLETLSWVGVPGEVRGSSIYKDKAGPDGDSQASQLRALFEQMPERLAGLVERDLAPWLRDG